jgi:Ca2+-binding RTX toxin-like protein
MALSSSQQSYYDSNVINWDIFRNFYETNTALTLDSAFWGLGRNSNPTNWLDESDMVSGGHFLWDGAPGFENAGTVALSLFGAGDLRTQTANYVDQFRPIILALKEAWDAKRDPIILSPDGDNSKSKTVDIASFGFNIVSYFDTTVDLSKAVDVENFVRAYPMGGDTSSSVEDFSAIALLHFSRNIAHEKISGFSEIVKNPWQFERIENSGNAFHRFNDFNGTLGNDDPEGQDNSNNFKWVSQGVSINNGAIWTSEYIFHSDFSIETDLVNQGSFNIYNTQAWVGHLEADVQPWIAFGNQFGDTTSVGVRNGPGIASPKVEALPTASVTYEFSPVNQTYFIDNQNVRLTAVGSAGNDLFVSGPQNDNFAGGGGIDTVSYAKSSGGVGAAVNLEYGEGLSGFAAFDNSLEKLYSIENLIGSIYGDIFVGSNVANWLRGEGGSDELFGMNGNDTIDGGDGEDFLDGGQGSDFLNGGDGIDTAIYYGDRSSYIVTQGLDRNYAINPNVLSGSFGNIQLSSEGNDTLVSIEKVRFRDGTFDIADLVTKTPIGEQAAELVDGSGVKIGTVTVGAPTQDQGSEIEFSLNLSTSGVGTQYRVALIIDVSGSMGGSRIVEAKAAYVDLINYLKDQGIADVTEFAVIPFQSSATLYEGLSADEAIARINSLNTGGGTEFGSAISRGLEFFDGAQSGITQIAYFLSDGQGSGASTALQTVAEVRAFGISSGASISSLNTIDSNNAVILNSASDLAASFTESEIKTADVDKIEVYLNGVLTQTITGDQLTDNGATGLNFSGTINGLDTSNADTLEAKVFFQDTSIPAQSVTFEIGDGLTEAAGTDGDDNIAFSLSQKVVDAGGGTDTVLANNLDNTVIKISGNGVIKTFGGNDTVQAGDNRSSGLDRVIDGGDGTDTVVYVGNFSEYTVFRAGGLIKVGTATDSLSNVEFLQFDDVKVRTSDLSVVQTLSASAVEVTENDSSTQVIFTVNLDAASGTDVTFDYATENGTAEAGRDFTAANGSITLLAGETQKTITIDVTGDTVFEGDEAFELQLNNANGAVFDGGSNTYSITGMIKNDDDANQFETGSVGDDVINTGKGNDQINSGAGNDIVNANLGNDLVIDGLGNNSLNGEGGADAIIALSGLNSLTGGDGSDYLAGGFQADNLNGGAGNDVLRGDAGGFLGGSDILMGGADDDFLMGGRGADTFVFNTNDGADIIAAFDVADMGFGPLSGYSATATGADFQSGVDHVQLAGFSTVNASNVMSSVTDGTDGAVFSAEGTSITFYDVAANQLTVDDFIFV